MAVNAERSAPYAPSSPITMLLDRNRDKGLPNPITTEVLQRLGVSESIIPRTLQALVTLDLIGEDGRHTSTFELLRKAPEGEYKARLAAWLKGAYAHVLDIIDPATADDVSIRDAFRHYRPISLQPRMITLFTSLFEAAGVRSADSAKPAAKRTAAPSSGPRVARSVARVNPVKPTTERQSHPVGAPGVHPALAGLLASLPATDQGWTKADRDRFLVAFGVVLDFAYPPRTTKARYTADAEDAEA